MRWRGPLLIFLIVTCFYWKLTLSRQFTFLESLDQADQILPWLDLDVWAIQHGSIPLWTPYEFDGQSLIGVALALSGNMQELEIAEGACSSCAERCFSPHLSDQSLVAGSLEMLRPVIPARMEERNQFLRPGIADLGPGCFLQRTGDTGHGQIVFRRGTARSARFDVVHVKSGLLR